jgi:hypothetical protein
MPKIDLTFTAPSYGRSVSDDDWETIEPVHIKLWRSAIELLSERNISARGTQYSVHIDWTPILLRHQRHHSAMKTLMRKKHASAEQALKKARFPRRASRCRVNVVATPDEDTAAGINMAAHVTECVLHDVFLMMNVAAPASCDFYRASLASPGERDVNLSLSNVHFESSLLLHSDRSWPPCKVLDLSTVISWFDAVRPGPSQIPQNPMERVLFALLHMARMEMSPMIIIWLFYAFESLLQTNAGENFNAIVRRLALLLDADEKDTRTIRKELRDLYDIRSSVVHGGFEVAHPAHNEILDKRLDENSYRILDAATVGHALLVSAIQRTIDKGWVFPKFEETLQGGATFAR